jgi:predicted RNA binding protein YcfA (HicA-like mRNA interferase family)
MGRGGCLNLPNVTGQEAIRAFQRAGFALDRISGSHHVLKKVGHPFVLSVPVHGKKVLKSGTLRSLIRTAGLTVDEFCDLLD